MSKEFDRVADSERAFIAARMDFLRSKGRVEQIRRALHDPPRRGTALRLLVYLTEAERQALFDDLLILASVDHSDLSLVREALLSLPRPWVLSRIEERAEPLLEHGTYVEFRRLLELLRLLDAGLTATLARRALASEDQDIREAGEDFLTTP